MKNLVVIFLLCQISPLLWRGAGGEAIAQDQHLIDSLQLQLKNHNAHKLELGKNAPALYDTTEANILSSISDFYRTSNRDSATNYANQTFTLSKKLGYKKGIGLAYNSLAILSTMKGDYFAALELHKKALKVREEIGNKRGIAATYNNIGAIYNVQDNYPEALKNFFIALKMNDESRNKQWQAYNLYNIGDVYTKQGNYKSALENFYAAMQIERELDDTSGFGDYYFNIGAIFEKQGNTEGALKKYFNAIKLFELIGDKTNVARASISIGNIYATKGNYAEALSIFFTALKIYEEYDDKEGIANAYINIGNANTQQNNYNEGILYLNFALSLSKQIGVLGIIKSCYESLAKVDSIQGNYQQALLHYKLFIAYRDSIQNTEITNKTTTLQLQYDTEKKEQQINLLTKESKLQQTKLQKQNTTRNVLVVALALIALLAGIIFNRYRIKQNANAKIETTLQHLKNTQEQLIEHEKLASLGKFTADVAREIEVPVKQINQLTKLNRTLILNIKKNNSNVDAEALKNNLQQIFNYGKEADAFVKKVLTETRKIQS